MPDNFNHYPNLECLAHLDLKRSNSESKEQLLLESSNIVSLNSFDMDYHGDINPALDDHYMTTVFEPDIKDDYRTVTIFACRHSNALDTIDIPTQCRILNISGK
jgi:hypothetical protein